MAKIDILKNTSQNIYFYYTGIPLQSQHLLEDEIKKIANVLNYFRAIYKNYYKKHKGGHLSALEQEELKTSYEFVLAIHEFFHKRNEGLRSIIRYLFQDNLDSYKKICSLNPFIKFKSPRIKYFDVRNIFYSLYKIFSKCNEKNTIEIKNHIQNLINNSTDLNTKKKLKEILHLVNILNLILKSITIKQRAHIEPIDHGLLSDTNNASKLDELEKYKIKIFEDLKEYKNNLFQTYLENIISFDQLKETAFQYIYISKGAASTSHHYMCLQIDMPKSLANKEPISCFNPIFLCNELPINEKRITTQYKILSSNHKCKDDSLIKKESFNNKKRSYSVKSL